jgi:hypothetical protein
VGVTVCCDIDIRLAKEKSPFGVKKPYICEGILQKLALPKDGLFRKAWMMRMLQAMEDTTFYCLLMRLEG